MTQLTRSTIGRSLGIWVLSGVGGVSFVFAAAELAEDYETNKIIISEKLSDADKEANVRLSALPLSTKLVFIDAGKALLTCPAPTPQKEVPVDFPDEGESRQQLVARIQNGTCQVRFQK